MAVGVVNGTGRVKNMHIRTKKLRALMAEHDMYSSDIGRLLERSAQTVRSWRCGARIIPQHTLALLELVLAKYRLK